MFAVKSAGPHWSFGLQGNVSSSSFDNTALNAGMAPAVEYSVFPYSEYASRQLRIQYQIGPTHAKYYEITLYNRLEELRGAHEVSVTFEQRQPWGTLDTQFEFSQYLHDASKYRLEFNGDVSVRLFRGFSVSVEGSVSRIRDQLSLPRRDAAERIRDPVRHQPAVQLRIAVQQHCQSAVWDLKRFHHVGHVGHVDDHNGGHGDHGDFRSLNFSLKHQCRSLPR
jgi:hypothetical protein